MKLSKIVPVSITRAIGNQTLRLQKQSPNILFGVGIVGVIGGTVLACRATLKADGVLDDIKNDVEDIKKYSEPQHASRNLAYAYSKGGFELVRLYGPAIVVTGASIMCLTKSHMQLTQRNAALTVAYTGLQSAFDDYRSRVRDEVGEEKELDIYQNATYEKVKVDGKTELVRTVANADYSQYARIFDELNDNWKNVPEYNKFFLRAQQNYLNDRLVERGHVFLNEVYEALGFEHTPQGSVMGWRYVDAPGCDKYIDFGIFKLENSRFVNNWERSVVLDFNVDDKPIWDQI